VSTPIRPPSGPLPPGVAGVDGAADIAGSQATAIPASAPTERVEANASVEVQGSTATLLARLEAGEVTRDQAIEGLVREALEQSGAARLPTAQRAELESVLRSALLDDPTLSRLLG
jgi:hypothetical protein